MNNIKFLYILYKDIKRFLRKHKYAFCLIVVFILVFIFSKYQVFGFSGEDLNGNLITFNDIPSSIDITHGYFVCYTNGWGWELKVLDSSSGFFYRNGNDICFSGTGKQYKPSGSTWTFKQNVSNGAGTNINSNGFKCFCSVPIYTDINKSGIWYQPSYGEPYISQNDNELSLLNNPYIQLYGGGVPSNKIIVFSIGLVTGSETSTNIYTLVLSNTSVMYKENNGNYYYEIPVALFRNLLETGSNYYFTTYWSDGIEDYTTSRLILFLGLSGQEQANADIIGGLSSINSEQAETNEKLEDIKEQNDQIISQEQQQTDIASDTNAFLKDDSFDNSDLNIPTDSTQDITQNGINNIFTQIYNGFTSGEATDIVIPIPFTGKSFTINSNLTSNVLNSNGFGWLKTIIEAFWWYIISVFIVKDISKKINKIKSGDFENIETNNIKEDML